MKRIWVIAAHPDDEVLGCGGVIAKHIAANDSVQVFIVGEGEQSRTARTQDTSDLENQCRQALEVLGCSEPIFLGLRDNRFDSYDLLDIVKAIEKQKEHLTSPDIVYTHSPTDINIDHRVLFEAVLTAFRPVSTSSPDIYSFYVPSSSEWSNFSFGAFTPDYYVDISSAMDKKIEALAKYKSELRDYPHPRSKRGIQIVAQYWGLFAGLEYCEPLKTVRRVDR